jgi:succinate-semialdehyde dehydrogenase/glutarate-semialdehyde dehydrogenase
MSRIEDRIEALLRSMPTRLWIGGRQVPATGAARFPVINPATGKTLIEIADAQPEDAGNALDAAVAAQASWAATPPRTRAEILRRAWELIQERADDFALAMTLEMGKTLSESRGEVAYGSEFLRWFSEEAVRINGRYTQSPTGNGRILVTKQPVGPTLAITPWNFPLAMGTRKIGPAFAAGCTVIVKPAQYTPLTMMLLGEVFAEAGLPEGVLSIVPTTQSSALSGPLLADSRLRKLTFTGSTTVGKKLIEQSASTVLRTSMELGGNAPFIVFDDAEVAAAVEGTMQAKMRNGGEACTAANRIYVANAVLDEFLGLLSERMAGLRIGAGYDDGVDLGPLVSAGQRASVDELVRDAVDNGARIHTGGSFVDGPGFFYQPTVLSGIADSARILREEIFGPVATVVGFSSDNEVIAAANDTPYGLAAYVYTRDLERALRVSEALEAGMVGVNRGVISDVAAPFGGVKESGLGREAGSEGIEEYLDTKYIALP